jgi:hypothetical protein
VGEWKLFTGDTPHVSTYAFHEHRVRAPHLEQPHHRPRLEKAAELVHLAAAEIGDATVSDLGCGDGGLLSLIHVAAWGYDWAPANEAGWAERGVVASRLDVFGADRGKVLLGDIAVVTEVLEHLADPHEAVRWIGSVCPYIVASSPWTEHQWHHDECHAWAWDPDGYEALITQGGYTIRRHDLVGPFQVILGAKS